MKTRFWHKTIGIFPSGENLAVFPYFPGSVEEKLWRMEFSILLHVAAAKVMVVGILVDEV